MSNNLSELHPEVLLCIKQQLHEYLIEEFGIVDFIEVQRIANNILLILRQDDLLTLESKR